MVTTPWSITTPEKKCCRFGTRRVQLLTLVLSRNQANRETGKLRKGEHFRLLYCFVDEMHLKAVLLSHNLNFYQTVLSLIVISVNTTLTIFLLELLYVSLFQVGFSEAGTSNTRTTCRAS